MTSAVLNDEDNQFLDLIVEHPNLLKPSHEFYHDEFMRKASWGQIALALAITSLFFFHHFNLTIIHITRQTNILFQRSKLKRSGRILVNIIMRRVHWEDVKVVSTIFKHWTSLAMMTCTTGCMLSMNQLARPVLLIVIKGNEAKQEATNRSCIVSAPRRVKIQ